MTALVEISENQMKTKGGFSPVLEDQTLITWRYLSVPLSHIRGLVILSHISYHLFFFCAELLELLMEEISIHKTSIQLLTLENRFSSLPACHSARMACPELQNPLFQKAKENLLPWEKVPLSGRMRGEG